MRLVKNLAADLLYGLVFWLPIGLVVLAGRWAFGYLEGYGGGFLALLLPDKVIYPGLGTALWALVFVVTGLLLRKTLLGHFLAEVPILGLFFRKGGETISPDRLRNLTPCLFLYSPTCPAYGWILSGQGAQLPGESAQLELVNVYYPNVPTIVTGQVYSLRKETVMRLSNPSREILDILLYGLRRPENIQYCPWEGENAEAFQKRAQRFGLGSVTD